MKKSFLLLILPLLLCSCGEKIRETSSGRMEFVSLSDIKIDDGFWKPFYLIHRDITLPLCVEWTENHFDSTMVSKAAQGIAYSLQFEKDPQLAARRGTWVTRLKNETVQQQSVEDTCEVSRSVSEFFNAAEQLRLSGDGKYADDLEQILYNKVLPGISLKGDSFSSDLPESSEGEWQRKTLEDTPGSAMDLFRAIPYVGNITYGTSKDALWVNLYIGGEAKVKVTGKDVTVHQTTTYPWDGYAALTLELPKPLKAEVRLRIPAWCADFTLSVNGSPANARIDSGYAVLSRKWRDGDKIELVLDMPVNISDADFMGKVDQDQRTIRRGPIIYCMEYADNQDGFESLHLSEDTEFQMEMLPKKKWWGHELMRITAKTSGAPDIVLIPYFAWGNRTPGKMRVLYMYEIT